MTQESWFERGADLLWLIRPQQIGLFESGAISAICRDSLRSNRKEWSREAFPLTHLHAVSTSLTLRELECLEQNKIQWLKELSELCAGFVNVECASFADVASGIDGKPMAGADHRMPLGRHDA